MLCGEVRSPVYEAIHTRRIFFVGGEYWVIVDSLRGSVPHKYDLRFHLTPEALNYCTRIDGPHNTGIRTPEMVLLFMVQLPFGSNCPFSCSINHGWISESYGLKKAAPVVSVVSAGQANVDFYTLIAPRRLSAPLPRLEVFADHVRVEGTGADFIEADELSATGPTWRRTSI